MKKTLALLVALLIVSVSAMAQSQSSFFWDNWEKHLVELEKYKDKYNVDFSENVYIERVLNLDSTLKKEDIYYATKEHYAVVFGGHLDDVMIIDDMSRGMLLFKGNLGILYSKEFWAGSGVKYIPHIIVKIEIKEHKVRVRITIYTIDIRSDVYDYNAKLSEFYPINKEKQRYYIDGRKLSSDQAEKERIRELEIFNKILNITTNAIDDLKYCYDNYSMEVW